MRDQKLYLKDIIFAMKSIQSFTEGMEFEDFETDDKTISAVIQKFEIIGEAAKRIPNNVREKHSGIPWKQMAGMRDRLIHSYFEVDKRLVWDTIQKEIPKVKTKIEKLI